MREVRHSLCPCLRFTTLSSPRFRTSRFIGQLSSRGLQIQYQAMIWPLLSKFSYAISYSPTFVVSSFRIYEYIGQNEHMFLCLPLHELQQLLTQVFQSPFLLGNEYGTCPWSSVHVRERSKQLGIGVPLRSRRYLFDPKNPFVNSELLSVFNTINGEG